jgi:hypothetical protein
MDSCAVRSTRTFWEKILSTIGFGGEDEAFSFGGITFNLSRDPSPPTSQPQISFDHQRHLHKPASGRRPIQNIEEARVERPWFLSSIPQTMSIFNLSAQAADTGETGGADSPHSDADACLLFGVEGN